jgi:hypothetical protein
MPSLNDRVAIGSASILFAMMVFPTIRGTKSELAKINHHTVR